MSVRIVDAEYVLEHMGEMPIVDVRPGFMYGAGHIPTAVSMDFWFLKTQNGFTLPVRLEEFLGEMGVGLGDPLIVYCGSGQISAEACEVLEGQGFSELRHYAGGWSDWAADKSRPRES